MRQILLILPLLVLITVKANDVFTPTFISDTTNNKFFIFSQISESEFRQALDHNFNAPFMDEIIDSSKLEEAFSAISKTYNEWEEFLATTELCSSPRCLTSFKAYYPTLDLYLFYVQNLHYESACFVYASTNELASGYRRFRGSYGVMSKDGFWIGLERDDCDNYLQIEVCELTEDGVLPVYKFDFTNIDINYSENPVLFWANKNTIFIATSEYNKINRKQIFKYYSILFKK